jgi:hypothetical protein
MAKGTISEHQGTLNIRGVPKGLLARIKTAAAVERRTVKAFLLNLAEARIHELQRQKRLS